MGESKHTPGPWTMETVRTSSGLCHKVGPFPSPKSWQADKPAHACIYDDYPPAGGSPELVANARLIAAAPEMLAALQAQEKAENKNANCPDCNGEGDWAECGRCSELFGDAIDLRHAAIAKAEGR